MGHLFNCLRKDSHNINGLTIEFPATGNRKFNYRYEGKLGRMQGLILLSQGLAIFFANWCRWSGGRAPARQRSLKGRSPVLKQGLDYKPSAICGYAPFTEAASSISCIEYLSERVEGDSIFTCHLHPTQIPNRREVQHLKLSGRHSSPAGQIPYVDVSYTGCGTFF